MDYTFYSAISPAPQAARAGCKFAANLQEENGQTKQALKAGDVIHLENAEKTDTFHLVSVDDNKYLVDHTGKIVLVLPSSTKEKTTTNPPAERDEQVAWQKPVSEMAVSLRIKPGTPEFSRAVREADQLLGYFFAGVHRLYRQLTSRFGDLLENNHTPFIRYLESGDDPLARLKSYLIRELFSRTVIAERGLEIIEFLTSFIALKPDGNLESDRELDDDTQKKMVVGFLVFIRSLGDSPTLRHIFEQIYADFNNQDFEWMKKAGGVGYYISSSVTKTLKAQRDFLSGISSSYHVDTMFRHMIRSQTHFFVSHILAYLKALTILRLVAISRKEERGRNERERENLFYSILSYMPDWYRHRQARRLP